MFNGAVMAGLRFLDPERAHSVALSALRFGFVPKDLSPDGPAIGIEALGCRFRNPIGLAAGFDKNAVAIPGLARLGFGFLEMGTVTPRPQIGNPRPRLFRLTADRAVVNRMGFNNRGVEEFVARLAAAPSPIPVGANIGINKEGAEPEQDYRYLVTRVAPYVQYIVLNVSSPNTPGLRDLQGQARLRAILESIRSSVPDHPPLLVKIAPDLPPEALPVLIETCISGDVQGLIISNTTIVRPAGLLSPHARQTGGLSGKPLFPVSTRLLAKARLIAGERLVLIGVGGVASGFDALVKIQAGASLVQLYTAFAYSGPALIPRLKRELAEALRAAGFSTLQSAVGSDAKRLAEMT